MITKEEVAVLERDLKRLADHVESCIGSVACGKWELETGAVCDALRESGYEHIGEFRLRDERGEDRGAVHIAVDNREAFDDALAALGVVPRASLPRRGEAVDQKEGAVVYGVKGVSYDDDNCGGGLALFGTEREAQALVDRLVAGGDEHQRVCRMKLPLQLAAQAGAPGMTENNFDPKTWGARS